MFGLGSKGGAARIDSRDPELLLDPEQVVVLGQAVGTAQRAGLDVTDAGCHCKIGDSGVFGLSGAVGDDGTVSSPSAPKRGRVSPSEISLWHVNKLTHLDEVRSEGVEHLDLVNAGVETLGDAEQGVTALDPIADGLSPRPGLAGTTGIR